MPLTLKDIAVKLLHGELPPMSDAELARLRLGVCAPCDQFSKIARQCKACGCFLDLKVRLLEASCPLEKW